MKTEQVNRVTLHDSWLRHSGQARMVAVEDRGLEKDVDLRVLYHGPHNRIHSTFSTREL